MASTTLSVIGRFKAPWRRGCSVEKAACIAVAALTLTPVANCAAFDIVAIEEHWELKVGEPDQGASAPQVTMVVSPDGNLDGVFFAFTLNHHNYPEWAPGGMQVQRWAGGEIAATKAGPVEGPLHHTDETVSWVQRLSLDEGVVSFSVVSGQSESWGAFGGQGHLRLTTPTSAHNLNAYSPGVSIQESGVGFAGNRVKSLILKKLRWFDAQGNAYELNAPIDVDADLDPDE